MQHKFKRWLAAITATAIASIGLVVVPAGVASAHTGAVTGVATCEADGTYSVTWTYQARNVPSGVEAETKAMTTNQGSLAVIDGVNKGGQIFLSVWTEHQINVPGAPVKTGNWSGQFKTVGIPGTFKGDVTTMVQTDWKNGPSEDPVGKVYVDGSCKAPTPDPQFRDGSGSGEWSSELVNCTEKIVTHTRDTWTFKETSTDGGKTWTEVPGSRVVTQVTETVRDATVKDCPPPKVYPPVITPSTPVPTPPTCDADGSYTLPGGGEAQTGGPGQDHGVVLDGYTLYVQNTTGVFGGPGEYTWQAYGIGAKGNEAYPIGTSVGGKVDSQGNPKAGGKVEGAFIVLPATGDCPVIVDDAQPKVTILPACGYASVTVTNPPAEEGRERLTASIVIYTDGEFYKAVSVEAGDKQSVRVEFPEDSGDHLIEVRTGPAFGDEPLGSALVTTDCLPPEPVVTFTDWEDGAWLCGDTTTIQTRSVTTTSYLPEKVDGVWILDKDGAETVEETRTRDLTEDEQTECPVVEPQAAIGNIVCTEDGGASLVTFDNTKSNVTVRFQLVVDNAVVTESYVQAGASVEQTALFGREGSFDVQILAASGGAELSVIESRTLSVDCEGDEEPPVTPTPTPTPTTPTTPVTPDPAPAAPVQVVDRTVTPAQPALAVTGTELTVGIGVVLVLIAAGAVLITIRRNRKDATSVDIE